MVKDGSGPIVASVT
jgi:hypothetical protein